MKWIGQRIQNLISRFRNDVYLEDVSTGTIASGGNLGLDSDNKIVKATISGSDGMGSGFTVSATTDSNATTITQGDDLFFAAGTGITCETTADGTVTITNTVSDTNTNQLTEFTLTGDSGSNQTIAHGNTLDIAGGNAISTAVGATDTVTINHDDTSSQASVNNSGSTYIQDVTLDTYGHVTGLTSAAVPTLNQDTTGNAATATALETARNIAGVSFDGTASISLNNNAITNGAGYTTNTGDITSINITTDEGGGEARAIQASGDADFSILGANGVGVTNSGTTITATAVPGEIDHDSLNNFEANEHFTQANITTVGTIGTGTWQGTAIASAYLDADTAHYSAIRQATYNYFKVDLSSKVYVGLQEADAEHSSETNKNLPILAPVSGKLLKVFLRTGGNVSAKTLTITLEHLTTSNNTNTANVSVVGTQSGAGPTSSSMVTYDFTSSLDSGTNVVSAGDMLFLGFASSASTGNILFYVTSLWEWDYS